MKLILEIRRSQFVLFFSTLFPSRRRHPISISAFFFQSTFQLNVSWGGCCCEPVRTCAGMTVGGRRCDQQLREQSPFLRPALTSGQARCSYETHVPFLGAILNYTSLCADQYLPVIVCRSISYSRCRIFLLPFPND